MNCPYCGMPVVGEPELFVQGFREHYACGTAFFAGYENNPKHDVRSEPCREVQKWRDLALGLSSESGEVIDSRHGVVEVFS